MSDVIRHETVPRIFFDEPVALFAPGSCAAQHGRALNLSTGGMYVCCEQPLAERTIVRVQVVLPAFGQLEAEAVVVRVVHPEDQLEPAGMALCFMPLAEEDAERLAAFIEGRLRPPAGEPVRLQLGELDFPISARTGASWGNLLSVDAELPFLRLGTGVRLELPAGWEAATGAGSIRWVSIHVPPDTGVPRLNIGIELAAPPADLSVDEEADPVCSARFAEHSRTLDHTIRSERRASSAL
jgi:hypothetical protein